MNLQGLVAFFCFLQILHCSGSPTQKSDSVPEKTSECEDKFDGGPIPEAKPFVPPKFNKHIQHGQLQGVSMSEIFDFINEMRELSASLLSTPLGEHGPDCYCFDHMGQQVLQKLAEVTQGYSKYGFTVLERPTKWKSPFLEDGVTQVTTEEDLTQAYFVFAGIATLIFAALFYRSFKMPHEQADADEVSMEAASKIKRGKPKFDITRVDVLE